MLQLGVGSLRTSFGENIQPVSDKDSWQARSVWWHQFTQGSHHNIAAITVAGQPREVWCACRDSCSLPQGRSFSSSSDWRLFLSVSPPIRRVSSQLICSSFPWLPSYQVWEKSRFYSWLVFQSRSPWILDYPSLPCLLMWPLSLKNVAVLNGRRVSRLPQQLSFCLVRILASIPAFHQTCSSLLVYVTTHWPPRGGLRIWFSSRSLHWYAAGWVFLFRRTNGERRDETRLKMEKAESSRCSRWEMREKKEEKQERNEGRREEVKREGKKDGRKKEGRKERRKEGRKPGREGRDVRDGK